MPRTIAESGSRHDGAIRVREADLEADRDLLIDTLRRQVNPRYDRARFDWAYRQNPFGDALAWIAEGDGGEIVGVAAAFPRRFLVAGREASGWVFGDFCVSERHRSLGPALQLQRACLAEARRRAIALCYDAPNPGMMAVHTRIGACRTWRMVRLARPLRVDRHLGRWLGSATARRLLAPVANLALTLDTRLPRPGGDVTVELHRGPCGVEFTELAREVGASSGIRVHRTAEYVTWRFLETPVRRHEILVARRGNTLCGYVAFTAGSEQAVLVDLSVVDGAAAAPLLAALLRLVRTRRVATVSAPLVDRHPCRGVLEQHGFRPRETSPIVTYGAADADTPWSLTYADFDG